jgi:sulfur-carrier protein
VAKVTVRYWAAARSAAGRSTETVDLRTPRDLSASAGPELARVLEICSFLVDGVRSDAATPLTDGSVVDVLPPFAGG